MVSLRRLQSRATLLIVLGQVLFTRVGTYEDLDGDGVEDRWQCDRCPGTAGTPADGCP